MTKELKVHIKEWLHTFPCLTPVVVVPVFNAYEDVLECVESLLVGTPLAIPILLLDDASTDERIPEILARFAAGNENILYVRKPFNAGFVNTANLAFESCAPRDVVILNSDVVVPPAWLERLQAAAYHRSNIATATPFTNHGTIVSVPYHNQPISKLMGGTNVEEVDHRIRTSSLRLYPVIPTAIGHCVYFKRVALDVVGHFDEAFNPGYGEEVDFCQRSVQAGFLHILVDDLFVYHKGSKSFQERGHDLRVSIRDAHEALINKRYRWYAEWVLHTVNDRESPLTYAIEQAADALLGARIAIDATCLSGPITGTQLYTLGLIRALAAMQKEHTRLSIIVHDHVKEGNLFDLNAIVDEVVPLSSLQVMNRPCFSLIHRPFQLQRIEELAFLRNISHRIVISMLDFIAFSNASYAINYTDWHRYRELTQCACSLADGIVFISQDVAQDAMCQGIYIEPERNCVIPPGVNHQLAENEDAIPSLPEAPFLLVLGTDFQHKNRLYALKIFQILMNQYRWQGSLVFAGPAVSYGGSRDKEVQFLRSEPEIRARFHNLGAVSESEKLGLLKQAALVLYPSVCEGFGLVPLEAAIVGTPALASRMTSLAEVLGDQVLYLNTFDPQAGAEIVWKLLSDSNVAARQVAAIQERAAYFTWDRTAEQMWEFYQQILTLPPRSQRTVISQSFVASNPEVLSIQGPFLIRVSRRLRRSMGVILAEWLGLCNELRQFIQYYTQQLLSPFKKSKRL